MPLMPAPAAPISVPPAATPPALVPPGQLSASQLVDELAKFGTDGPITAEQAARFKKDLEQLIQRGAASVPAIQDFLGKFTEISYGSISGGDQLGFSSLRTSLIDALVQIGGPEAQAVLLSTLNTTAVPSELLQLANGLSQQAPGQYRDEIMNAAQETLAMASANQLGTNTELQSAFRVVQTYGNVGSTADAANSNPMQFYNAVQLANLPDGQGLSSLVQMEQSPSADSHIIATEMIAQLAGQNADALDALSQMAQNGKIQPSDWVQLAPILGGNQYQIDPSGQNSVMVGGNMTPDQINQRIWLIDAFMGLVPDGSGAAKSLAQQRSILAGKLQGN